MFEFVVLLFFILREIAWSLADMITQTDYKNKERQAEWRAENVERNKEGGRVQNEEVK